MADIKNDDELGLFDAFGIANLPPLTDRQKVAYGGLETPLPVILADVNAVKPESKEDNTPAAGGDLTFPELDESFFIGQLEEATALHDALNKLRKAHEAKVNRTAIVIFPEFGVK